MVHAGIYRERIDPPRGGLGDDRRVTYRAAPGERVVIKGSEPVSGWKRLQGDPWSVDVPNTLIADFNPFADLIRGDWFRPWGRKYHDGAVYLNGHWLTEGNCIHGPYLVDHNLFLSDRFLWDMSTGGAFAHNLAVGDIQVQPQERRTPYHEPHSTALAGLSDVPGGDNRWFNNLLAGKCSLDVYRKFSGTMVIGGNVDLGFVPQLVRKDDGFFLVWDGGLPAGDGLRPVTSKRMGSTRISKLPFEHPDASPCLLDEGYFRKQHKEVLPGPFAAPPMRGPLKVWPR